MPKPMTTIAKNDTLKQVVFYTYNEFKFLIIAKENVEPIFELPHVNARPHQEIGQAPPVGRAPHVGKHRFMVIMGYLASKCSSLSSSV